MLDAKESLKLPKSERQKHNDLFAPCLERGGTSTNHRGVLAQFLNTTIPTGRIILAHACGNGKCSNPLHMYWATDRENIVEDGIKFGTYKKPWDRMVDKYGYDEACKMQARGNKSIGGKALKGKPKTEAHKKRISDAIKAKWIEDKSKK